MDTPDFVVISSYGLEQAFADGLLLPLAAHRWHELSGGKPIVLTVAISETLSPAAVIEIWNEFVRWRRDVMATLPEEDQMFTTKMNGTTVWLIEDGAAFTVLFPEDY